jgi:hypothetical protein
MQLCNHNYHAQKMCVRARACLASPHLRLCTAWTCTFQQQSTLSPKQLQDRKDMLSDYQQRADPS